MKPKESHSFVWLLLIVFIGALIFGALGFYIAKSRNATKTIQTYTVQSTATPLPQ